MEWVKTTDQAPPRDKYLMAFWLTANGGYSYVSDTTWSDISGEWCLVDENGFQQDPDYWMEIILPEEPKVPILETNWYIGE